MTRLLERSLTVGFLRTFTNLQPLADLFAEGIHERPEAEIRAWCEAHGIHLLPRDAA
jgi:hypothetical protein